jgi:histidine kinase
MDYIRERLGAKLFLANLAVILVGVVILAITIQLAIPAVFNRHMGMMTPSMMNGMGMGQVQEQGQGQGPGLGRTLFENFRVTMFESLGYAVTASVLAALLVSVVLSRRIVAPVRVLTNASQHIAKGHYDERVRVDGTDEIAQLAARFNQMAAQLEEVENMRRQLIGDVTHELRTPLTSIKGYMEGLMDGVLPSTPQTFNEIHREADRLSRLVDDLQELSRIEAKSYSLDIHSVPVSSLIQTTLKRLAPQAAAKQIQLQSKLPPDLPPVEADEDRITQVLFNLVANAIQYTPEGGQVIISAVSQADQILVSVSDSGIGIPPEHLANLFTRFYRVDKSRSRSAGGGSGIGLTIAKHLVEAHGGQIWVESKGDGQGSAFTFTLRIAK